MLPDTSISLPLMAKSPDIGSHIVITTFTIKYSVIVLSMCFLGCRGDSVVWGLIGEIINVLFMLGLVMLAGVLPCFLTRSAPTV